MKNLLLEIRYNGARYHGYQVQPQAPSIMQAVQDAVERTLKRRDPIVGCSRTDAGVHANQYFLTLKTEATIPLDRFQTVMNRSLPPDIALISCKEVPLSFHARYDCVGKEYLYIIDNGPVKNPFFSDFALYYDRPLQVEPLEQAAQALVGTHDFTALCSPNGKDGSNVRTISYIHLWREGDMVYLKVKADGFLYHMVRIIVGTLLFMNEGKIPLDAMGSILLKRDRRLAGKTAPPQGLYLNQVEYGEGSFALADAGE